MRLLYLVTEDWYFCSHRLPLAIAAREAGYEVVVATRVGDHAEQIRGAGLQLVPLAWSRRSRKPLREIGSVADITALYRRLRPDIVHHVALKPVLYGSLAARISGVPAVVNALAGLGYIFSSQDRQARVLRPAVHAAYRLLLDGPNRRLIVQNPDDKDLFSNRGLVAPSRIRLIKGSGVSLDQFAHVPEPEAALPLVVLPARMLRDKGVEEFVVAARLLKAQGIAARFALVGDPDAENPAAIDEVTLNAWEREGVVEYWGWRKDMAAVFRESHLVCLPSYREGLPKALIEAAASGRAIVTCDVPGCRDVVVNGENGLLVPPRDSEALANALRCMIENPEVRARMGARGRARAVTEFSLERAIAETLSVYQELLPR